MAEVILEKSFKSPRFYVLKFIAYHGPNSHSDIANGLRGKVSQRTIHNILRELENEGILYTTIKREGRVSLPYDFTEDSLWLKELLLKPESVKSIIESH